MAVIKWVTNEEINNRVVPLTEEQKKIVALEASNNELRDTINFILINY